MQDMFIPINLLCEYSKNPIGIDTPIPRFLWEVDCTGRSRYQSAYRILVASEEKILELDIGDLWDSGQISSSRSINVEYSGKALKSAQKCFWKVRIWDNNEIMSLFSKVGRFETGLLEQADWKAKWIGTALNNHESPYFRKEIEIEIEKDVLSARVYIAGLGYYELSINGEKAGNHVLDTAWTDYGKRVLYSTYDVTEFLKKGENVAGVILGCGWFGFLYCKTEPYMLKMIFQMEIQFRDGTSMSILSDDKSGWLVSNNGPIVRNSIYDGETYDARLEMPGWDSPGFDISASGNNWKMPVLTEGPGGVMVSQTIEPIKVIMDIKPVDIISPKPGVYVFDLGQNIAGWAKLRVQGQCGTKVIMKFAELLYKDGTINRENIRAAKAEDTYILKGGDMEFYEPRFTYHGFRYVQVEGYPGQPDLNSITGRVVRSSVEPAGSFNCGNDMINRIHKAVVWTEGNNIHGLLTDCPQRDERVGWLNDATVRVEEALYNFNLARLLTKWERDIADTQLSDTGAIADTAPYIHGGRPADPVCSSYLIIPWLVYLHYGDKRILEEHYSGMKKWVELLISEADNYIVNRSLYGDWASPVSQTVEGSGGAGSVSAKTPGSLISTGFFYCDSVIMAKIAGVLGIGSDEKQFRELSDQIKNAFNKKFFDEDRKQYATGSQASNAFPLYLGIVPTRYKNDVVQNLVKDVMETNNGHLTTGNLCTRYIMDVLAEEGFIDVAFTIACQTTYPSWGYMIENGATTIWERWEYVTGGEMCAMASHNHPMYGSVDAWFYKILAGIKLSEECPGFEKVIIKPYIPKGLDYAEGTVKTLRGLIKSSWRKENDSILLNVTIPFNSSAEVYIPFAFMKKDEVLVSVKGRKIWKNGILPGLPEGIIKGEIKENYIVFVVSSGTYSFRSS